jgi:hypothetical protein
MDEILRKDLNRPTKVTVFFECPRTKEIVKITMEGNGLACYDIRNRIVMNTSTGSWLQLRLHREVLE